MAAELRVPESWEASASVAWFREWSGAGMASELRLVLPEHARLTSSALVLLAAGLAARERRRLATEIRGPEELRSRLASMRAVTDFVQARAQADARAGELERQLEGAAPSPLRMARFVYEELGANVVQHSGASETGFGMLEASADGRGIELAFADAGVGFLTSMQRNPELAGRLQDEAEALQLALGKGVSGTGTPRRNMGIGLGLLQDFSDRTGGDLWLASGSALLRRRSLAGARTSSVQAIPSWAGSWICLAAPLV